jgi:MFS family permease
LADAFGPVTIFIVGMAGFIGASVGIALAGGAASLITWRVLAGCAGALLIPASMSVLVTAFPGEHRARALAIYLGVGQAFATVGPAIGGVCAQFFGWEWGFGINVPVGAIGIILVLLSRPENPRTPVRTWDIPGLVTLVVGLTGLVVTLLQGPLWGWASTATLSCAGIGLVSLTVFIRRSWTGSGSLLNLRLFQSKVFASGSIVLFGLGFAMTAATIYGAVVLQNFLQLQPAASGLALLPLVIPLLIATRWVATHYNEYGPRRIGAVGCACLATGSLVVAGGLAVVQLWVVCAGLVLIGAGIGLLMTPMTTAGLSAAPDDERGQASGLISTCRQLGGIVGVGVFSALISTDPTANTAAADPGAIVGFVVTAGLVAGSLLVVLRGMPRVTRS